MDDHVETDEQIGRRVIATGAMQRLREDLGLSRRVMAEYLHVSSPTYHRWEDYAATQLRKELAERVGRFYTAALNELALLTEDGVRLTDLAPLHEAAQSLGVPQEVLLRRHRAGEFAGEDLGILGLWIDRRDLDQMRP